jgi:cyclin-C
MAANFWVSTQRRHWMFTRERLAEIRENLKDKSQDHQIQLPDVRVINIFLKTGSLFVLLSTREQVTNKKIELCRLAKLTHSRQQAISTAQVYMKRFYTKVDFRQTNPYLVMVTAFYLACKMEECPQHIRVVSSEARQLWPEFITNDPAKIGECEFYLISEMHSQLIVHHPYRTVLELTKPLELTTEDVSQATTLISDHYQTDLPLLYPPHVIAVMAILLAVMFGGGGGAAAHRNPYGHGAIVANPPSISTSLREAGLGVTLSALGGSNAPAAAGATRPDPRISRIVTWLAESEVDIKAVIECTQEMISLYEVMDGVNIQQCKEIISRMIKTRNADK